MSPNVALLSSFVPAVWDIVPTLRSGRRFAEYTCHLSKQATRSFEHLVRGQFTSLLLTNRESDHFFQSQGLPGNGGAIPKPFSSSSLPPSLASGRLATTFLPRAPVRDGGPVHLRRQHAGAADHAQSLLPFLSDLSQSGPGTKRSGPRVAVVGSGISGLSAAWALSRHAQVTLFESGDYFGGHTHTVDVTLEGQSCGVDTGFLVFNERTYPLLIELFAKLGVELSLIHI